MDEHNVSLETLTDLCTPWCVHTVVTFRVAEHIAAGSTEIAALAQAVGCDEYALHRVLSYLVDRGLFLEPSPGRFELNELARKLMEPSARIGLDLHGIGGRMAYSWGTLPTYVATGVSGYKDVFGLPFWEDLDANPEVGASFDDLIGPMGHGKPNGDFQIGGGWESVHSVVDVGGGTGAMLAQVLSLHPQLHGVLVDLPRTVALSSRNFEEAGVGDRVTTIGQSFFDPLPAGHDLYYLKGIVNDWPDEEAVALLRRCAEAAKPNGRVVVLGGVVKDEVRRGLTIEMVLVSGKHRTVSEFRKIAHEAGLDVLSSERQATGHFVSECRPR